ncbi:NAD(P)/FAD-dependent oxidoreductase [Desulfolucanica intricata]|uniref:NAD(P)/FAD-dependent oxidoreductase n=1 Tax=Desulfolucanica intricata TaxID=1285191 RepID=UPI000831A6B6|nr:NAD(P)/FAD-dependent oxidoreductase [Desulfolucanica intricata]
MLTENRKYDLAIIGCGPAGLSAAINAKIRRKNLIICGGEFCSPKLHSSPLVDNYLGFPKIKGEELRRNFLNHIKEMDIKIYQDRVSAVYPQAKGFEIVRGENNIFAKAVIIATGVTSTKFIPGEKEFLGRGVGYCATCDGPLYSGKRVALIGYVKDSEKEANFLAEICETVFFIPLYREQVGVLKSNIEIVNEEPKQINGRQLVTDLQTENKRLDVNGIFIYRETVLPEQLVPGLEIEGSTIKVNRSLETNISGIYAAGDCTGSPYQLAKAVGEGLVAALNAVKYLDSSD